MNLNLDFTLPVSIGVILDVIVVVLAVFYGWRGWRKGIIGGLCSILAMIVAFYGARLIADTYSGEFTGLVEPFATGIVDTMVNKVTGKTETTAEDGEEGQEEQDVVVQLSDEEKNDAFSVAYAVMRQLGVQKDTAAKIVDGASQAAEYVNSDLSEFLAAKISSVAAYIVVYVIAFVLISIVFAIVGNILDLVFNLPGIELVNKILGMLLGLVKAFCIFQFLGLLARFTGIIIPDETIAGTWFFKYFVDINYLAAYIGL